jgi:hypothetical protein
LELGDLPAGQWRELPLDTFDEPKALSQSGQK